MLIEYQNLIDAIKGGSIEMLLEFHMQMLNLILQQGDDTFLHVACRNGSEQCVDYLLDNGVDTDHPNGQGKTPLMLAYDGGHWIIMGKLIAKGADTRSLCPSGLTLFQATLNDAKIEAMELLLSHGVDVNQRGSHDVPTLYVLLRSPTWYTQGIKARDDLAKRLVTQEGVDPCLDYVNPNDGTSMLHLLLTCDLPELLEKALEADTSDNHDMVNKADAQGLTPLMYAATSNQVRNIEVLVKRGAKVDRIDPKGFNALKHAIMAGREEATRKLVELGSDLEMFSDHIMIWVATQQGLRRRKKMLNLLAELMHNPIPNQPYECCTFLHYAAGNGFTVLVNKILDSYRSGNEGLSQSGRDALNMECTIKDDQKLGHGTPLKCATQNGWDETVKVLLDAGADMKKCDPLDPMPEIPEVIQVYIDRDLIPLDKPVWDFPPACWKMVAVKKNLPANKKEMISMDDISEIKEDRFMILRSGICWDLTNLVKYIIETTKGVNQYDAKSPYAGSTIWTEEDLQDIYNYPLYREDVEEEEMEELEAQRRLKERQARRRARIEENGDESGSESEYDEDDLLEPEPELIEESDDEDGPPDILPVGMEAGWVQGGLPWNNNNPPLQAVAAPMVELAPMPQLVIGNNGLPQIVLGGPARRRRQNAMQRRLLRAIRANHHADPNNINALLGLEIPETYGQILKDYLDIGGLHKRIDRNSLMVAYEVGSILWARGQPFEELVIKKELSRQDKREWDHWKGYLGFEEMPYDLSERLRAKFEKIKQEQLYRLHETLESDSMTEDQIDALNTLCYGRDAEPKYIKNYLMQALNGSTCVMTFGSTLVKGYRRFEEYENTLRRYGQIPKDQPSYISPYESEKKADEKAKADAKRQARAASREAEAEDHDVIPVDDMDGFMAHLDQPQQEPMQLEDMLENLFDHEDLPPLEEEIEVDQNEVDQNEQPAEDDMPEIMAAIHNQEDEEMEAIMTMIAEAEAREFAEREAAEREVAEREEAERERDAYEIEPDSLESLLADLESYSNNLSPVHIETEYVMSNTPNH